MIYRISYILPFKLRGKSDGSIAHRRNFYLSVSDSPEIGHITQTYRKLSAQQALLSFWTAAGV